jgi:hypothetical protein
MTEQRNEARQLLAEETRGTIMDHSFASYLMQKWSPFLKGVDDPYRRKIGAFLFENEAFHLKGLKNRLEEATTTANVAYYTKYLFPILRKLIANLIAPEIVSVQPMNAPVGAVFYLDVYYGQSKGQINRGSSVYDNFDRFYTSEFVDREQIAVGDGTNYGGAGSPMSVGVGWTPVRPLNTADGFFVRIREYDATGAVVQEAIDNGSGGFTGNVTSGTINYQTGAITGFLFTAAPLATHSITAEYFYNSENNSLISEYYFDIRLDPVKARDRKVKARITSNAIEDFRAMHGVDAETTVTDFAVAQIALEIDREIIMDLWSQGTALAETFDFAVGPGIVDLEHYRSILTKFAKVAADIHKTTRRGPANFGVTSPDIMGYLTQLQTHGDYHPIFTDDYLAKNSSEVTPMMVGNTVTQFGVTKMGTLAQKWLLYQDPYFPNDGILLGYKGPSFIHAGYVYAPYVPIEVTSTFLNPEDFALVKGLKTRYAKKMLRGGSFYGRITCLNV